MFEQITSIPGYQVYIWLLSILGSAAIHLRVRGDYSRPAVVETLLIYLAGVGASSASSASSCTPSPRI